MADKERNNKEFPVVCACVFVVGLLLVVIFLALKDDGFKNKEDYYIWGPGRYPGWWGYRVPPWRRRWWLRRRGWGRPLYRYYNPYYDNSYGY